MKVTTELKNLIRRSFAEKRASVERSTKQEVETQYDSVIASITDSDEFKNLAASASVFYDKYKDMICSTYGENMQPWYASDRFTQLSKLIETSTATYFFPSNCSAYSMRCNRALDAQLRELNLQEEALLIKLTYEKDLDIVRAMLAEYDITI